MALNINQWVLLASQILCNHFCLPNVVYVSITQICTVFKICSKHPYISYLSLILFAASSRTTLCNRWTTKLQDYKKWDVSNLGTVTISNWRQGNGTPSIHETWINRFPFKQIQVPGTENLYLILLRIFHDIWNSNAKYCSSIINLNTISDTRHLILILPTSKF